MAKTIFERMPEDLVDFLSEQIEQKSTMTFTKAVDSDVIIIRPSEILNYVIYVEWDSYCKTWSMVNIDGDAWDVLCKNMST